MAYRNGTYVAFHAEGTPDPTASDMKYYQLLKAWTERGDDDFSLINSHEKASSVRDSSKHATLRKSLQERLRNSRNMVLIIGQTTRFDTDWVPFEIEQAIDTYELPIIAAYPDYLNITAPAQLASLWPQSLATRISSQTARVIHVPFRKQPLADAIGQFDHNKLPNSALAYYSIETYRAWGLT
jgi:hypothetical protein